MLFKDLSTTFLDEQISLYNFGLDIYQLATVWNEQVSLLMIWLKHMLANLSSFVITKKNKILSRNIRGRQYVAIIKKS